MNVQTTDPIVGWVERSDTHQRRAPNDGLRRCAANPSYGLNTALPANGSPDAIRGGANSGVNAPGSYPGYGRAMGSTGAGA